MAGERWEGPFQVPYLSEDLGAGGDPVLAFDRDSNVYMAYISIGVDEFNLGPIEVAAQVSSIAVATLGGRRLQLAHSRSSSARSRSTPTASRQTASGASAASSISASSTSPGWPPDRHPDDPEKDDIYVTYTNFDLSYEILYIGEIPNLLPTEMRTTIEAGEVEDGGSTWTRPRGGEPHRATRLR